jgi:uncharacterized protein YggE
MNRETRPDPSLEVSETSWAEIAPTAADVHVVLTADRLFSGRAALAKAEELRRVCVALEANGIPESSVSLSGVSLDVSSGLFTKSSSVTYRLRIHLTDLDHVAPALDAIANAKKATLSGIEWDYSGPASEHAALLGACAARAASKAKALASALGVTLAGARVVREERLDQDLPMGMQAGYGGAPMAAKSRATSIAHELAGLDLAPKRKIGVRVHVTYTITA